MIPGGEAGFDKVKTSEALEKIAVHKILTLLREAYQHFGRASTEISAVFHHLEDAASPEWEPEPYNTFEASFAMSEKLTAFKTEVEQEADAVFSRYKLEFFKSVYRLRRMVSSDIMLAEEVAEAFVRLRENWPASESADCEGTEILRGIAETIEIKIEGLRESIGQMTKECAAIIDGFAAENVSPSDEDILAAKAEIWQLWTSNSDHFEAALPDLPIFAERRNLYEKSTARCEAAIEKNLMKFKRETLLYELSTYEEITFYSVSRLRGLEPLEFRQAAALADDTLELLDVLLKKNNIDIIRPRPHDTFNPREHEALMAESNPGFNKGEIVKLMNSGYKQKDVVLLRANVIAAR